MREWYIDGAVFFFRHEALILDLFAKWRGPICGSTAVPHHSSRACGLDHSLGFDVRADVRQCPLTDIVLPPHVQRGSFTLGLRPIVFRHAGKYRLG